jgi:hypothetical protein
MIKTFIEFVNEQEELESFYDDIETNKKRLKLMPKFKSDVKKIKDRSTFSMGEPKKKFKPKTNILRKPKKDKGIF